MGTLSTRITNQLQSLQGLHLRLRDIGAYLQKVLDGDLPVNHAILGNLQDVFNLLPNLSTPATNKLPLNGTNSAATDNSELARAMSVKTNDQLMTIYLSSLVRAITAFHDLIENKIQNRQQQEEKDAKKEEESKKEGTEKEKEKEGAEEKKGGNGPMVNGESKREKDPDAEDEPKSKGKKPS